MNKVRIQTFERKFTVRAKHKIDAKMNRKDERRFLFFFFLSRRTYKYVVKHARTSGYITTFEVKKTFFYFA